MTNFKLCVDCRYAKWMVGTSSPFSDWMCQQPDVSLSMVTGKHNIVTCYDARAKDTRFDIRACGREGRYWEAKEEEHDA